MSKYQISAIKTYSFHRKYEHLREFGMTLPNGVVLKGQELDDYMDEVIWRHNHPNQEPIKEWES